MEFMVSMVRGSTDAGGRDRYSCSMGDWDLLLQIGKTFGWKPAGSTYLPAPKASVIDATVRHDYEPGDKKDYKQVDAQDAVAWAQALSEARRSPHLAAMVGVRSAEDAIDPRYTALLDEFIAYAYRGEFSFALTE
jgi:hypothetical protein